MRGLDRLNKDAYLPPSEVPQSAIDDFAEQFHRYLKNLIPADFEAFGARVTSIVDHMVPPNARDAYRTPLNVIGLATFEVGNLGQKIRRYQFVERYKFFVDMPDTEIGIAFHEHCYEVRNAELYGILERGEALIRFAAALAAELDSGDEKAPSKYARNFRREFDHRLRERHRRTHAHERPSLISRILQIGEIKTKEERQVLEHFLRNIHSTVTAAFEAIQEKWQEHKLIPSMRDPVTFQQWYLQSVDEEAATMWRLFTDALSAAVKMPNDTSSSSNDEATQKG
jgi:hypothetical protein